MKRLKLIALGTALGSTTMLFGMLLFADELVRATTTPALPAPASLPPGVEIRLAPRLTRIIGAPSGGASAVTVGRTILVPHMRVVPSTTRSRRLRQAGDTLILTRELWDEIIRHEVVHTEQRVRYGRWYLPVYLYWYGRRGYRLHPLELEAGSVSGTGDRGRIRGWGVGERDR